MVVGYIDAIVRVLLILLVFVGLEATHDLTKIWIIFLLIFQSFSLLLRIHHTE